MLLYKYQISNMDINGTPISGGSDLSDGGTISGDLTLDGNQVINGDLDVNGTLTAETIVTSVELEVQDPIILCGKDNPADAFNLGLISEYTSGTKKYAGMIRNKDTKQFNLFTEAPIKPTPTGAAPMANGQLKCGLVETSSLISSGLTYPLADGTQGGVIETDGAGSLNFTNKPSLETVYVNRPTTAEDACVEFQTSGTSKWSLTLENNINDNLRLKRFNPIGSQVMLANLSTGQITFNEQTNFLQGVSVNTSPNDYTLPTDRGQANYFCRTLGNGTTEWADPLPQPLSSIDDVIFKTITTTGTGTNTLESDNTNIFATNTVVLDAPTIQINSIGTIQQNAVTTVINSSGSTTINSNVIQINTSNLTTSQLSFTNPQHLVSKSYVDTTVGAIPPFADQNLDIGSSPEFKVVNLNRPLITNDTLLTFKTAGVEKWTAGLRNNSNDQFSIADTNGAKIQITEGTNDVAMIRMRTNTQFYEDVKIGDDATFYSFPTTRGSNQQALITDGSGNITWQNIVNTLPQGLDITSSPTFNNVIVNQNIIGVDACSVIHSVAGVERFVSTVLAGEDNLKLFRYNNGAGTLIEEIDNATGVHSFNVITELLGGVQINSGINQYTLPSLRNDNQFMKHTTNGNMIFTPAVEQVGLVSGTNKIAIWDTDNKIKDSALIINGNTLEQVSRIDNPQGFRILESNIGTTNINAIDILELQLSDFTKIEVLDLESTINTSVKIKQTKTQNTDTPALQLLKADIGSNSAPRFVVKDDNNDTSFEIKKDGCAISSECVKVHASNFPGGLSTNASLYVGYSSIVANLSTYVSLQDHGVNSVGTFLIPAGTITSAGTTLHCKLAGNWITDNQKAYFLRFTFGDSFEISGISPDFNSVSKAWEIEFDIIVSSVSAGGGQVKMSAQFVTSNKVDDKDSIEGVNGMYTSGSFLNFALNPYAIGVEFRWVGPTAAESLTCEMVSIDINKPN